MIRKINQRYVCFEITLYNNQTFMHFVDIQNLHAFINDISYLYSHVSDGIKSIERVFISNDTPGAW